jgi:transaldolase/glucose-6-phosphate isomerase
VTRLRSHAGIANATLAYALFQETVQGSRWAALAAQGATVQRPLWASTGTKDPQLPDTYYVDALIGPETVATLPLATLTAFNDHGTAALTLGQDLEQAREVVAQLAQLGIVLPALTAQLEDEGVRSFADAYDTMRQGVAAKYEQLRTTLTPHEQAEHSGRR